MCPSGSKRPVPTAGPGYRIHRVDLELGRHTLLFYEHFEAKDAGLRSELVPGAKRDLNCAHRVSVRLLLRVAGDHDGHLGQIEVLAHR